MERELIIFSTVRSNYKGELGFMKDPRRLNVALTRAKRGLIIVGDTGTLSQDTYWKNFIDWAK
jgi:regulator of nonsense transcripts 1